MDMGIKQQAQEIANLMSSIYFKDYNKYGWIAEDRVATEYKLYPDIDNDKICFYHPIKNGKLYINEFDIRDSEILQKIIDLLCNIGISQVYFYLKFSCKGLYANINFKDVRFRSYYIRNANISNLLADFLDQSHQFEKYYQENLYAYEHYFTVSLYHCHINNNILINNVSKLTLEEIENLNDFSFIKAIQNNLTINYTDVNNLPKCNSLKGIPNGTYSLSIKYIINYDNHYENMPLQTLEGLHNNLSQIDVKINENPTDFLQHFSFKGLTLNILPKFNFEASRFPGKFKKIYIQLGPYKLEPKVRTWKPTKPQYETIIKTQDWFLDCYFDKPNKEYISPEYDENDKDVSKQMKKFQKEQQKKDDAKEDLEQMVKNLKKVVAQGDVYFCNLDKWKLKIKSMKEKNICYYEITKYSTNYNTPTYEDFIRRVLLTDNKNLQWRLTEDPKSKTLYQLICVPVQNKRKRILQKRKEEEKQLRAEEKNKLKNNISPEEFDINNEPELEIPTEKAQKKITDVDVIDYSDKAIAVIGNTYPIKDQLKELGAVFNKRLFISGKKQAGWILSKKKKEQVELLLY